MSSSERHKSLYVLSILYPSRRLDSGSINDLPDAPSRGSCRALWACHLLVRVFQHVSSASLAVVCGCTAPSSEMLLTLPRLISGERGSRSVLRQGDSETGSGSEEPGQAWRDRGSQPPTGPRVPSCLPRVALVQHPAISSQGQWPPCRPQAFAAEGQGSHEVQDGATPQSSPL